MRRGSNMVGATSNIIQYFKIFAGTQLKPVFGGFKTRLKFIKFGHRLKKYKDYKFRV